MREAYAAASRQTGVPWAGRSYDRGDWRSTDPVNRCLSAANSCLYGVCHAAILSAGYSLGLGFIHTGKQLSFVYDVADLYKTEVTIPAAFEAVAECDSDDLERTVRVRLRDHFSRTHLLARVVDDLDRLFDAKAADEYTRIDDFDVDAASPGGIWDPAGSVDGGVNYSEARKEEGFASRDT